GYAAAARVHDDTAEARWRAAQKGSVQIDPVWRLELPSGVDALAVSRDGVTIAAGLSDHSIALLDSRGRALRSLEGHEGRLTTLAFSPDGQTLISAGEDRQLLAWNIASGDHGTLRAWAPLTSGSRSRPEMRLIRGEGHQPANRIAFAGAGAVVSASNDGTVRFFSLDGQQLSRINTSHGAILTLAAPD